MQGIRVRPNYVCLPLSDCLYLAAHVCLWGSGGWLNCTGGDCVCVCACEHLVQHFQTQWQPPTTIHPFSLSAAISLPARLFRSAQLIKWARSAAQLYFYQKAIFRRCPQVSRSASDNEAMARRTTPHPSPSPPHNTTPILPLTSAETLEKAPGAPQALSSH